MRTSPPRSGHTYRRLARRLEPGPEGTGPSGRLVSVCFPPVSIPTEMEGGAVRVASCNEQQVVCLPARSKPAPVPRDLRSLLPSRISSSLPSLTEVKPRATGKNPAPGARQTRRPDSPCPRASSRTRSMYRDPHLVRRPEGLRPGIDPKADSLVRVPEPRFPAARVLGCHRLETREPLVPPAPPEGGPGVPLSASRPRVWRGAA